jgi:hypothetical protein
MPDRYVAGIDQMPAGDIAGGSLSAQSDSTDGMETHDAAIVGFRDGYEQLLQVQLDQTVRAASCVVGWVSSPRAGRRGRCRYSSGPWQST